jgi:hypothetical protein
LDRDVALILASYAYRAVVAACGALSMFLGYRLLARSAQVPTLVRAKPLKSKTEIPGSEVSQPVAHVSYEHEKRADKSEFIAKYGNTSVNFKSTSQGLFFALFGAAVIVVQLVRAPEIYFEHQATRPPSTMAPAIHPEIDETPKQQADPTRKASTHIGGFKKSEASKSSHWMKPSNEDSSLLAPELPLPTPTDSRSPLTPEPEVIETQRTFSGMTADRPVPSALTAGQIWRNTVTVKALPDSATTSPCGRERIYPTGILSWGPETRPYWTDDASPKLPVWNGDEFRRSSEIQIEPDTLGGTRQVKPDRELGREAPCRTFASPSITIPDVNFSDLRSHAW